MIALVPILFIVFSAAYTWIESSHEKWKKDNALYETIATERSRKR